MMAECCVCGRPSGEPALSLPAPSVTSTGGFLNAPLSVFVCSGCGHARSTEMPDLADFYDTQYRISLATEEHDQLYEVTPQGQVFRTDKQAAMVLELCPPKQDALVLDYGAGKAETLRKIFARRPDITPHVFDVSQAYAGHWSAWLQSDNTATYELPAAWRGRFDLVTAHFVLEHVSDPVAKLRDMRGVLHDGGMLFASVPDAISNSGDLLVADHINHFSAASFGAAAEAAGFRVRSIVNDAFRGAFVIVAEADAAQSPKGRDVAGGPAEARQLSALCAFWVKAAEQVESAAQTHAKRRCAIYGAGFYGSYLFSRIHNTVQLACFIDRNPHVQATPHLGLPVVSPADLPEDVEIVFAGLNPASARRALTAVPEWKDRSIEVVFLD